MLNFQNNIITVIETFEDFTLTVYIVIDDLYHHFPPLEITPMRRILASKLSNSKIIISLCGELLRFDMKLSDFLL